MNPTPVTILKIQAHCPRFCFLLPLMYLEKGAHRFSFGLNEMAIASTFLAFTISVALTPISRNLFGFMEDVVPLVDYSKNVPKYLPVISFALSLLLITLPWFNAFSFYHMKKMIIAANGDYDGIKGFNISPEDYKKNKSVFRTKKKQVQIMRGYIRSPPNRSRGYEGSE